MGLTFNFEKSYSPLFGNIYRPVARTFFYSKVKKRWYETWMIVDTGADYTLLPRYFSVRLGVDLKKECKLFKTSGIGGNEKVYLLNKIKARLGSWERMIPVGFLNRDEIPPLLGRHLFLETFDIEFLKNHQVVFKD